MHKLRGDEVVREMEAELSEFSVFDLHQILDATGDFSEENKLGEGGFGPVYKVYIRYTRLYICLSKFTSEIRS
jgi:hypothetical protein